MAERFGWTYRGNMWIVSQDYQELPISLAVSLPFTQQPNIMSIRSTRTWIAPQDLLDPLENYKSILSFYILLALIVERQQGTGTVCMQFLRKARHIRMYAIPQLHCITEFFQASASPSSTSSSSTSASSSPPPSPSSFSISANMSLPIIYVFSGILSLLLEQQLLEQYAKL